MNFDDIDHALLSGHIDADFRLALINFLRAMSYQAPPPVGEVLQRLQVEQLGRTHDGEPPMAHVPANVPQAEQRPGMLELFRRCHQGAMDDVDDTGELARCDTFQQVQAIVRSRTQSIFAKAIRDIVKALEPWLARETTVIPRGHYLLRAPASAETIVCDGTELAILPWRNFTELFWVEHVDALLALLRRSVELMGYHFARMWFQSNGTLPEVKTAALQLERLRQVGFPETMGNGFGSGVADVVNPLHVLVVDFLDRYGASALTQQMQDKIIQHHEDFSVFLATFSLTCIAELEHVLRVPASIETQCILSQWTAFMPNPRGKGFGLDCAYAPEYFTVRYLADGTATGIPILDFNVDAFPADQIERVASRTIRLGCPSLGYAHRLFTRAMCRAYFQVVLPPLVRTRA